MGDLVRYQWIADNILRWEPEVRRWLHRKLSNRLSRDDIDDLIQDAYFRIWTTDFEHIRDGRTFFYSVARNVLIDRLRRARVVQFEGSSVFDAMEIEGGPNPELMVSAGQQYERLLNVVRKLPPRCREIFSARKFEGLSILEIAVRMGLSQSTVQNQIRIALSAVTRSFFGDDETASGSRARDIRERTRKRD